MRRRTYKLACNVLKGISTIWMRINPAGIYLFKVNNGDQRTMCEICLKSNSHLPKTAVLFASTKVL